MSWTGSYINEFGLSFIICLSFLYSRIVVYEFWALFWLLGLVLQKRKMQPKTKFIQKCKDGFLVLFLIGYAQWWCILYCDKKILVRLIIIKYKLILL